MSDEDSTQQDPRIERIISEWTALGLEEGFDGEFAYRAQCRIQKEDLLDEARREGGDIEEAIRRADSDDSDLPYGLRGKELRYGKPREPWLLHGLEINRQWLTPDAAAIYEHRLETSDALYEAGWPGTADGGGRLLFEGFHPRDREDFTSWRPWNVMLLDPKFESEAGPLYTQRLSALQKSRRFQATLDSVADGHDDHWFFAHPFCRECFPSDYLQVDGYYAAWLVRQRSETAYPGYEWDGQVPPMPVIDEPIDFVTLDDLASFPEPSWLIDGVLPDHGTGVLRARDQSFKSFMALSWALTVASEERKVLYCVGEGVNSFGARIEAWLEHNGMDRDEVSTLDLLPGVPNLFTGGDLYDRVLAKVRREGYDLVIIDTYARATAGSDLNSQGDQSVVTARVDEIKRACDGAVLLVAHSQKSDTDSSGSIEIEDARDFVFSMKRKGTEGRVTFEITKQKDGVETPRPVEYVTKAVGSSIVLVEAGEEGPSLMTEKDWVVAALHNTQGLGARSVAEIRTWINSHENRDKAISDSTLTSTLSRMVTQGSLTKEGTKYALTNPTPEA